MQRRKRMKPSRHRMLRKKKTYSPDRSQWIALSALVCMLGIALVLGIGIVQQNVIQTAIMRIRQTPSPTATPSPTFFVPAMASISAVTPEPAAAQTVTQVFEPVILIYHTHATEAYSQDAAATYTESGSWRTLDETKNVVAVGELLAACLREEYGFQVLHDTTNHEPPKLSTAYSRSEVTMKTYFEEYPSLKIFVDVHRDAYGSSGDGSEDYIVIDGKESARIMFVVGTGQGATGTGFDEMPHYKTNYVLAQRITDALADVEPGLIRQVRVKTGRYNQHVGAFNLLVEVGHNRNTLQHALNSVPLLAKAIAGCIQDGAVLGTTQEDIAVWTPTG